MKSEFFKDIMASLNETVGKELKVGGWHDETNKVIVITIAESGNTLQILSCINSLIADLLFKEIIELSNMVTANQLVNLPTPERKM